MNRLIVPLALATLLATGCGRDDDDDHEALPTLASVTIVPESPHGHDDLSVVVDGFSAPGADEGEHSFEWRLLKDGGVSWAVIGDDAPTLTSAHYIRGDRVRVSVTPRDTQGRSGHPVTSEPVTVLNSLPVVLSVTVEADPEPAVTYSTLTCLAEGDDDDGDEVTLSYAWEVDGEPAGEDADTLEGEAFAKHQEVVCVVTPFDGVDEGAPMSSEPITVLNAPPTLEAVTLNTYNPLPGEVLVAELVGLADPDGVDDLDDPVLQWWLWDEALGEWVEVGDGTTSLELDEAVFESGDRVFVEVTPYDLDGAEGPTVASAEAQLRFPLPSALFETFEDGFPDGWTATGSWQVGVPSSGPYAAFEGSNVAATNLFGAYPSNDNARLSTPALDLTGVVDPVWRFEHWYDKETSWDGGNLKISTNGGTTFTLVPASSFEAGTLGYYGMIDGLGFEVGWSGFSGGWRSVGVDLDLALGGAPRDQVVLQWHFGSDYIINYEGWYLDLVRVGAAAEVEGW